MKAQLIKPEMNCYKGHSHIECMAAIQKGFADVSVFDASDVYTAGLRHDLIPIISEIYNLGEVSRNLKSFLNKFLNGLIRLLFSAGILRCCSGKRRRSKY